MKHTRSSAEWEIRDALVSSFHENEPNARIVHELNVAGTGSNRADLGIVFPDTLVLIEIKSAKDTLSRLEPQFEAFQKCSHMVLIVAYEKHFNEQNHLKDCEWMRWSHREHVWKYPAKAWTFPRYKAFVEPHAYAFLDMLWAEELKDALEYHQLGWPKGAPRWELIRDLTLKLTGKQVRETVCRQLRQREFAEADAPINAIAQEQTNG